MIIGTFIAVIINTIRSSKDYHDLERRPSINDDSFIHIVAAEPALKQRRKNKDVKVFHASRAPINRFRKTRIVLFFFVTTMVVLAFFMEGFDDVGFLIAVGAGTLLIFSPILVGSAYNASCAEAAIASKRPYLEFYDDGMICHSRLCGPVLEILWSDMITFTPVFPALGSSCSILIEHRVRGETKVVQSRYLVNVVDIELAQFVSLLEFYTGLDMRLPTSNVYHACPSSYNLSQI